MTSNCEDNGGMTTILAVVIKMAADGPTLLAPDKESIYIYFGHGNNLCRRWSASDVGVGSRAGIAAEYNLVPIPRNLLVVSFGSVGLTNIFQVQEALREISMLYSDWLANPIRYFNDILSYVNDSISKYGVGPIQMNIAMERTVEFSGVPFSYSLRNLLKSGLYDLYSIDHYKVPIYKQLDALGINPASKDMSTRDIGRLFSMDNPDIAAKFPRMEHIKTIWKKAMPTKMKDTIRQNRFTRFKYSVWNNIFEQGYTHMTIGDINNIASLKPAQWHIVYLPACRSTAFRSNANLRGSSAGTRGAASALFDATIETRTRERIITEKILSGTYPPAMQFLADVAAAEAAAIAAEAAAAAAPPPVATGCVGTGCTIAGGSRRRRSHKKRKTQRKR